MVHTACTIHLLNLPDKNARRDIIHGVKHLEEMGECWTAARRTLKVLRLCADRWNIEVPEEAGIVFTRIKNKWGMDAVAAPSPVSPQSLANIASQMTSRPLPDLMAQNVQWQQQGQRAQQQAILQPPSMPHVQSGLSAAMAPSPAETIDTRRSSGNMSLPPQTAAELGRNVHKLRSSTYLTKAQQDAWNAHQARMKSAAASAVNNPSRSHSDHNAAKLFGGVDSLMEETQEWFFRDQSQLAMGFGNWGEYEPAVAAPGPDWGTLDLNYFDTDATNSVNGHAGGSNGDNSPTFMSQGLGYTSAFRESTNGGIDASANGMASKMYTGYGNGGGFSGSNTRNVAGINGIAMNMDQMGRQQGVGGIAMNQGMGKARDSGFDESVYY
jgi:hypothetical protein